MRACALAHAADKPAISRIKDNLRMTAAKIGIIGGSGLYQMPELTDVDEIAIETPFGDPSDKFIIGTLEGETGAFLPRHGLGHRYTPSELPIRANIYRMKLLGVRPFVYLFCRVCRLVVISVKSTAWRDFGRRLPLHSRLLNASKRILLVGLWILFLSKDPNCKEAASDF